MKIKFCILLFLALTCYSLNASSSFLFLEQVNLANQKTESLNIKSSLRSLFNRTQSVTSEFHKIVQEAQSILNWLPQAKQTKEDRQQPKILFLPNKMLRVANILRKLSILDYNSLNEQDYIDYMLITYYLFGKYNEFNELKPAETDSNTFLPNFWEIYFSANRKPDMKKINYILNRIPQYKTYFEAAKIHLKNPYKDFLEETAKRINDYINFLQNQLTLELLDRFADNPKNNWMQIILRAILDAEDFREYLNQLSETAVYLTIDQKDERRKFRFLQRLRYQHFIHETPEELLSFGQKMFEEVSVEMRKISQIIRKDDNWHKIIEKMKQNHPQEEELKSIAEKQLEETIEFLKRSQVFPLPPRAFDIEVVEFIPKDLTSNTPYAFYERIGRKSEQKGRYHIAYPPKDAPEELRKEKLRDFFIDRMRVITVHECLPGHHLQFAYAQTVKRSGIQEKLGYSTAYVEGWGLYAEQIMSELGFYKGLKGKLTALKMRLWRAARVIIDVGRHFFGMTEEEAVKILTDEVLLEKINAQAEVKRYFQTPTQPLSYLYGYNEFNKMRSKMKQNSIENKKEFSLYQFHKSILENPYLQPYLLWTKIFSEYQKPQLDFKNLFSEN